MRLNGKLIIAVLVGIFLIMAVGCGGSDGGGGGGNSLVGTWQMLSVNGVPAPPNTLVLVFRGDGTGTASAGGFIASMTWSLAGNQLTMIIPGEGAEVSTIAWISSTRVQVVDSDGDLFIFQKM